MHTEVKSFNERNPVVIGLIGVILTGGLIVAALQYDKLPFFNTANHYEAYFAETGGLMTSAAVQVSGLRMGKVTGIDLNGTRVLITFTVARTIHLGERTEAAIKTKTLLGAKILEITPRGGGELSGPIPMERTT
ncbi:MAG: MlaD family protein, partial [Mycobacterium sp.]